MHQQRAGDARQIAARQVPQSGTNSTRAKVYFCRDGDGIGVVRRAFSETCAVSYTAPRERCATVFLSSKRTKISNPVRPVQNWFLSAFWGVLGSKPACSFVPDICTALAKVIERPYKPAPSRCGFDPAQHEFKRSKESGMKR